MGLGHLDAYIKCTKSGSETTNIIYKMYNGMNGKVRLKT